MMDSKFVIALCLALQPLGGFSQTAIDAPRETVRVSGRVVLPTGLPEVNVAVNVGQIAPDAPNLRINTDEHGVFTFAGQPGKMYKISLDSDFKTPPISVDTANGKDMDVGQMVFERCPATTETYDKPPTTPPPLAGELTPEQIIIDSHPDPGIQWGGIALPFSPNRGAAVSAFEPDLPRCWTGPSLDNRHEWENLCSVTFAHYITVEQFVGERVKSIHVIRYDPVLTQAQVKEEVRKVWLGIFRNPNCYIGWAEANLWNISAEVEFVDGRRSSFITDGGHVEIQDLEGKRWYFREWPAVD